MTMVGRCELNEWLVQRRVLMEEQLAYYNLYKREDKVQHVFPFIMRLCLIMYELNMGFWNSY
jgi:hypothetical protein